MTDELIINNITEFKDLLYKNCFYNSFFPIANHFGKKPVQYMINDIMLFQYSEESPLQLGVEYMPVKPLKELMSETGIEIKTKISSDTIIDDIIQAITEGRLVILWIDSFYESFREDTYEKNHLLHSLLIYGFSKSKQLFYIIEHEHQDTLLYSPKRISFSDIVNSYKGYLDNYYEIWGQPSLNEYYATFDKADSEDTIRSKYALNMLANKELIYERLESVKIFSKYFEMVCAEDSCIISSLDILIGSITNVINAKLANKYIIEQLFSEYIEIKSQYEKIEEAWSFIRATFARIKYSSRINRGAVDIAIDYTKQLFKLEADYYELLFTMLKELKA